MATTTFGRNDSDIRLVWDMGESLRLHRARVRHHLRHALFAPMHLDMRAVLLGGGVLRLPFEWFPR